MKGNYYMKKLLKINYILYFFNAFIISNANAGFEVIFSAKECTQVIYHGNYGRSRRGYVTFPIFDWRSKTFEFKSIDMNFKIFLEDTGNWALNAYLGSPDTSDDEGPYIKLNKTQIQLHGMHPKIYLYSNHDGIYIQDQDSRVFELMSWGHDAEIVDKIEYQNIKIDAYDYINNN